MRYGRLSRVVLLVMLGACTDQTPPSAEEDSGTELPAEDGSSSGCTAVGGTCVSYATGCPAAQQNNVLCEDSVLICCLPPGGEQLPDAGETPEASPPVDAPVGMDAPVTTDAPMTTDASKE